MRIVGGVFQAERIADAKVLRQCLRNYKVALWLEENKLGQEEVSLEDLLGSDCAGPCTT